MSFDAIVLAGGAGSRLSCPDKPAVSVGGRPMLDTVLDAARRARRRIVVGPGFDVVETPPGGGPLAAVAAGLELVEEQVVAVLAADLPFLTAAAVELLVDAAPAVAVDAGGREQWLCGAWPVGSLRAAIPADPAGAGVGRALAPVDPRRVALPGFPPPWWDCDTPADLEQARMWA